MTRFRKTQIISMVGFSVSIILITLYSTIFLKLIDFGEKYISQDHHFESNSVLRIKNTLNLIILIIMVLSISSYLSLRRKLLQFSSNFIDWIEFKKFFFTDYICMKKNLSKYLFTIGTTIGLLLPFVFLLYGQPRHEGIVENCSSFLFLFSGVILLFSSTRVNRLFSSRTRKSIIFALLVIAAFFFILFGEEISWGQRIFNWNSFGVFNDHNFQKETNAHNFFNPLFRYVYPIVGMSSFLVLFLVWTFPKKGNTYLFDLFVPHPSLLFLVFIMACSSFNGESEIYEYLLAVFLLLYSLRILICLSFPKN